MPSYIGAIDQGTTSTRFIVFDGAGKAVVWAQKEHRQIYPQPGWVEHDAEEIWQRTQEVIAEAMARGALTGGGSGGDRHYQPARDHRACGTAKTGQPLTTRLCGRICAWPAMWPGWRTTWEKNSSAAAPGCRSPPISARSRCGGCWITFPGRAGRAEAGEILFGTMDTFLPWHLTGGRPARHRRDQREPHAVDGSEDARVGRRNCCGHSRFPRNAAAHRVEQ